jgi:hypothetical protein
MFGPSPGRACAGLFTVDLDYQSAAGCPDAHEFEDLVDGRLGYDPFSEKASDRALVRIARQDGLLNGSIEWRDAAGKWLGDQTVPQASGDCQLLARTLALALTVQIRLLATTASRTSRASSSMSTGPPPGAAPSKFAASRSPGPKSAAPQPAPPKSVQLLPPATPSPDQPSNARGNARVPARGPGPAFSVSSGPSVGFGMSSRPILLGRVLGSVGWRTLSFDLAAEASLPTTTRRADGAGFSQQHLLASTAACALLAPFSACLLAKAGEVRMAGENIDRPTSAMVPIVEVGARVGVAQRLGRRLFVGAHAEGLANVTRWTATLDQVPVWTAPRFAAVLGIDVGVRSP